MKTEAQCRYIYREAFKDPDQAFENLLFGLCYKHCRFLEKSGKIVSILFALPCEIVSEDTTLNSIYIYAAATLEVMRGKGYMRELIEKIKKETTEIIFLRPANESLIKFYKKLGFKEIPTDNINKVVPYAKAKDGFWELLKETKLSDGQENYTLMYYSNSETKLEKLHFTSSME